MESQTAGSPVLEYLAILHNETHIAQQVDILQRVPTRQLVSSDHSRNLRVSAFEEWGRVVA